MTIRFLLFMFCLCLSQLISAQNWEEVYDLSGEYWGADWKTCSEYLEQALPLALNEFGAMDTNYLYTLGDLGVCYIHLGRYNEALELLQESLSKTEQLYGKQHEEYGFALNNCGGVYLKMGNYGKALGLFQEATRVIGHSLGKDDPTYGTLLNNLGNLYSEIGEYDAALPVLEESLAIQEKTNGKESVEYGITLNLIGSLFFNIGQYERALPYYQEACEITEQAVGKEHVTYGTRLVNLGTLYSRLEEYDKALDLLQQALEHAAQHKGKHHKSYGARLFQLGNLYANMDQPQLALPYLEETRTHTLQTLSPLHDYYCPRLSHLGFVYELTGQTPQAYDIFEELSEVLADQLITQFDRLGDRFQNSFLRNKRPHFSYISSFQFAHPEFPTLRATGYNQQLLLKGFLQNQHIDFLQSLRQHPDSAVRRQMTEWEELHSTLALHYRQSPAERPATFDSLKNRAEELEIILANQSLDFRKVRKQVRWEEVEANLTTGEAAIEFAHFPYFDKGRKTDSIIYVAHVLRRGDSLPRMIPLFEAQELQQQFHSDKTQSLTQLYTYRGIKPTQNQPTYEGLFELIWQPMDSLMDQVHTVYYAASGLLHRLNLGAIPINEAQLLSDKYALVQLGSTRTLTFSESDRQETYHMDAMLMGGIDYEAKQSEEDSLMMPLAQEISELADFAIASRGRTQRWQYLPGTATEIDQIHRILDTNGYAVIRKEAQQATEENLRQMKQSPRILHIASHGYFFPDPKEGIDANHLNQQDLPPVQLADHPMVRSGLILAGANHAWTGNSTPEGQEDGILTAYEISRMDLSYTELVVLSACETGLGDIQGNEGVYGLQRAFKIAGAKYVLMSLWQVPDQATQELMTAFYENWLGGMEIRTALNEAQQKMRKRYIEPYYWAGFVLVE